MANEFIARNGLIAQKDSEITGSLLVTNKVGIGTNDPLTTLHAEGSVVGPISAKYRSIIYANNTSAGGAYNNAIGLYAEVATTDGIAVYGNSTDSNGFGGYFEGRGYFSGNVIIGNSALPADTGFRLNVSGSTRLNGQTTITGSTIAVSAIARGINMAPTLVASANSDVLVGLDIQPAFNAGSFTGVQQLSLRLPNQSRIGTSANNSYNIYLASNEATLNSPVNSGTIGFQFGGTFVGRFMGTTGNLLLQNGGTFTDDSVNRLQVSGSAKISHTGATPLLIERTGGGNSNVQFKNTGISFFAGVTQFNSFAIGNINNDLGTNAQFSIFPTTGNVIIQNGGTPVDTGYRLDVSGSARITNNLTVTGSLQISSSIFQYSNNAAIPSGSTANIASFTTSSYMAGFFDFVASSGTSARAGTVFTVWNGTNVEYVETSTNDIGSTTNLLLSASLSGGSIRLQGTSLSGSWNVKTLTRMI